MCAESMSKNWVRCIDIILDCSVTTIYCCGLSSNKCLKLTLPLCPLRCYSSSTALGSENLTLTPSLDLSTLMGVRWETSDLNSWVWLSLGFQNSFPQMTIKSHSHCFLCAHLCHHLLLLYFPETCRAQLPLSLREPLLITVPALLWDYFVSKSTSVFILLLHLSVFSSYDCASWRPTVWPGSRQRPFGDQPPFPQTSFFWFLTWG